MPIEVEIPDHGVAEFPDEFTPEQIQGVIQKQFYPSIETKVPQGTSPPSLAADGLPDTTINPVPSVTDDLLRGDIKGATKTAIGKVEGYFTKTEPGAEAKNLYDNSIPAYHPEITEADREAKTTLGVAKRLGKEGVGTLSDIVHGIMNPMNMALMVETGGIASSKHLLAPILGRVIAGIFAEQAGEGAIRSEIKAASLPPGSVEREQAHFDTAGNVVMATLAGAGAAHPTGLTEILDRIYKPKTAEATEAVIAEPVRPADESISPEPAQLSTADAAGAKAVQATTSNETPISSATDLERSGAEPATSDVLGQGSGEILPTTEPKPVGEPASPKVDESPTPTEPALTPDEAAQPEAVVNGVVPAERVVANAPNPAEAAELSPQALGVTHPLPAFLKSGIDYFTKNTPSQIWNSVKGSLDATLGKTFAKTTLADRPSGELAARWISSRIAAPHLAETFATNVMEGTGVDPVKFGAALTEDNLRSIRKSAETPEDAAKVTTIIGAKNSPFKTEGEYKAFLADPATQAAIERHRALWNEVIDPMYRQAQNIEPGEPLPSRGDETGARINLYNDVEAKGKNVVSGTGQGNLTATMRKKSPFAIRARGTGQSYNVNYNDIISNTFGRQLEIANKNAFETRLVESGNAIIGKPAKDVTLPDGEETVAFPLKRTVLIDTENGGKIPVNQNIFVRKSLAGEYRRGTDVDLLKVPAVVRGFNTVVNRAALAGLTDASVHILNLSTALLTRPSIIQGVLTDSLLSATGRADVPVTFVKAITKGMQDNRAQLAELAEIGALKGEHQGRNPLGKLIAWADRTTRLVLDDAFKNMADAGLVERTETNRREFVNQVGQYNKKAQGDLRRLARDSGFGPFATAGTTFNTLGIRTLVGSPGIPATSALAAASLRANVISKWVGATVLVGALNYILTKDKGGGVTGRPGIPIGKVDTGLNDSNGRPLSIPVFDILGLGRALRVTGARGLIESQRKGLSLQNSLDAAATDIWNTNISPFTGPVVRFAGVASSGKQVPSINVPRTSRVVPPGESQAWENVKQAIIDANPVVKSIHLATEPGQGTKAAILQQIPRLALQPSQSAEFMAKYPEIVRKAQAREYVNDVIGRARKMNPVDQTKFVRESLSKLTPEDRKQAERVLKYSHIRY